jgi:hypothetical protein
MFTQHPGVRMVALATLNDTATGFTVEVRYVRYQFVPEMDALLVACRSTASTARLIRRYRWHCPPQTAPAFIEGVDRANTQTRVSVLFSKAVEEVSRI